MSPSLPSRPGGRIRLLVVALLVAVAAVLVAPAAGAAPNGDAQDVAATADRLTRALGADGAGAYLDASGRLTVNVLGVRAAAQVRAAGGTPRLVPGAWPTWSGCRRPWTPPGTPLRGRAGVSTWPPTPCW
jgi:hypothetical protein